VAKLTCPYCGSNDFEHYKELVITERRQITKQNKISKRYTHDAPGSYSMPEGINCKGCYSVFDYEEDENGVIYELIER
jgi:RNA polymerase subunit RPABC4/transcription elongation factor Spt4